MEILVKQKRYSKSNFSSTVQNKKDSDVVSTWALANSRTPFVALQVFANLFIRHFTSAKLRKTHTLQASKVKVSVGLEPTTLCERHGFKLLRESSLKSTVDDVENI